MEICFRLRFRINAYMSLLFRGFRLVGRANGRALKAAQLISEIVMSIF